MLELDQYYRAKSEYLTGIDEAGRGPLAGPLVVAAVTVRNDFHIEGLDDSKKLSDKSRRRLYDLILKEVIDYKIEIICVEDIDRLNILQATLYGMQEACLKLHKRGYILVDGNRLPLALAELGGEAVIKGDHLISAIAAASVLAKVARDDIMIEMDSIYPQYGFARNKGYGTREHFNSIAKYGITPAHRRSFSPIAQYFINFE